ncbi:MAG: chorismate-binding protein [Bdellovibrionota bacterium]
MNMQDNTGPLQLSNFLKHGAFYRLHGEYRFFSLSDSATTSKAAGETVWSPNFFDLQKAKHAVTAGMAISNISEFISDLEKNLQSEAVSPQTSRTWLAPNYQDYSKNFQLVVDEIKNGRIKKAVPHAVWTSNMTLSKLEKSTIIIKALEASVNLIPFGFWDSDGGILGTTPEILFHRKADFLKTMALAGTRAKTQNFNKDEFLNASKEREEHQIVVESMISKLSKLGEVTQSKCEVVEYPQLAHLRTQLELKLKATITNQEIVKLLHPTPALGVFPTSEMPWFKALPVQKDRQRFGAPLLFETQNEALALVCIRAIEWDLTHVWVSAGGGVVKESSLEGEWEEIKTKFNSIGKNLGLESIVK